MKEVSSLQLPAQQVSAGTWNLLEAGNW